MIRILAAAAILALAPQDSDVAAKVRGFIEQVRSEDLQAADDAVLGIVRLGPPAIEPLKIEIAKAAGDTKFRLEAALKQIERNIRRERAMGTPIRVTLALDDRPVADAVAELARASGRAIDAKDLPAGNVTLKLDRATFWEALDALCKRHGGVMWRVRGPRVSVEKRPYRDMPKSFQGNLILFLDEMSATQYVQTGNKYGTFSVNGQLAWIQGTRPQQASLAFDALEDDKGVVLTRQNEGGAFFISSSGVAGAETERDNISLPLAYSHRTLPDEAAEKLAKCRGSVTIKYVLETKRLLSIANPGTVRGQIHEAGKVSVAVQDLKVSGRDVTLRVDVTSRDHAEVNTVKPGDFCIVDSKGASHAARGSSHGRSSMYDAQGLSITSHFGLNVTLPEGVEVASLDFTRPTDIEEIVVPFDFKDLPFK